MAQHALQDFDDDAVTVDVEEQSPRSRARGEETTMHVLVNGEWHKRTPALSHTSCGEFYHSSFSPLRREELTDPLCTTCFTAFERRLAAEKTKKERSL